MRRILNIRDRGDKSDLVWTSNEIHNSRLIYTSTLITNIGNGTQTIAVSFLVYEITNSPVALALTMSSEFLIAIILQFLSGAIVDLRNPRNIMILGDIIRGIVLITVSFISIRISSIVPIILALIISNMVKPFYKNASFALVPHLFNREFVVVSVNTYSASLFQIGQLIGIAIAAPVIALFGASSAILLNGITFILSACALAMLRESSQPHLVKHQRRIAARILIDEWKETFQIAKRNMFIIVHIVFSCLDFIVIAVINLVLIPLNRVLGGSTLNLSLLDGAFAVGAIFGSYANNRLYYKIAGAIMISIGLLIQCISFIMIAIMHNMSSAYVGMLLLGFGNAISVGQFISRLQLRIKGSMKGRISSLRSILLSIFLLIIIPLAGNIIDADGVISFIFKYSLVMMIIIIIMSFTLIVGKERSLNSKIE